MNQVLGIDVGFSRQGRTWAISALSERNGRLCCEAPTFAASHAEVLAYLRHVEPSSIAALGFDAPITVKRLEGRPPSGRWVDARFSRGAFHGSRRGPQPSSIAVPHPGWDLYTTGMDFRDQLSESGWGVYRHGDSWCSGQAFEVIPKLTLTLATPMTWIAQDRPRKGNLRQIDNFLFERAFNQSTQEREQVLEALFPGKPLDASLEVELLRVANHPHKGERHELIGGLVAGLQALQVVTRDACVVGAPGEAEGYFLLPRTWHPDWERTWSETSRSGDCVTRYYLDPR